MYHVIEVRCSPFPTVQINRNLGICTFESIEILFSFLKAAVDKIIIFFTVYLERERNRLKRCN